MLVCRVRESYQMFVQAVRRGAQMFASLRLRFFETNTLKLAIRRVRATVKLTK
jgi:hypothetical protein